VAELAAAGRLRFGYVIKFLKKGSFSKRMKKLNIAMIGYKFMGKAHSNAWRQAPRFFETPFDPVMKVVCGRNEAEVARAARRAGAKVHGMPSIKTTVLVRGKPNALQAAGRDAGRKLMEIKRLRQKGHRIVIISEPQFWRLTGQ
jgi:hypothetical protein